MNQTLRLPIHPGYRSYCIDLAILASYIQLEYLIYLKDKLSYKISPTGASHLNSI